MSCGVWDTVSAMYPATELAFVNTAVPRKLKNAFHALSLHETRTAFLPILWDTDSKDAKQTNIRQCWLAGDHSDIGGGHPDSGLATISLLWMVTQYKEFTDAAFAEVMLMDCLTPLYLHWQEKSLANWEEMSFFNKQEYIMQSRVYTKGKRDSLQSRHHADRNHRRSTWTRAFCYGSLELTWPIGAPIAGVIPNIKIAKRKRSIASDQPRKGPCSGHGHFCAQ